MMKLAHAIIFGLLSVLFLIRCSTQQFAVRAMSHILRDGIASLYEESDLQLAEHTIPSNLKLLEIIIKSDPENKNLLLLAAEGYTNYALGFVEDIAPERASLLFLRAKAYGLSVLMQNEKFRQSLEERLETFQTAVHDCRMDDVPALFWTANAWSNYINLNRTNVEAMADIPKIQVMLERVIALDETYYFGGAHLVLGVIWASRPSMLGGDPQKAKEHFEASLRINDRYLMNKYITARFYAVSVQDRGLFRTLIQEILDAPEDLLVEQCLANQVAKRKAKILLDQEEELFF